MREQSTKIFSVICLLAALTLFGCGSGGGGSGGSAPSSPQPEAKVSLSPALSTVSSGDTFTRTVEVENVGATFYVAFDLTYDPSVIEYMDATEGTFLNQNGLDGTSFQDALQNGTPGRLAVGLTRTGPIGEASGSGTLLSLTFRALTPGTTSLAFANPKGLKNSANQDVVIDIWENGTITVQ